MSEKDKIADGGLPMPKYTIRYREIYVREMCFESESPKQVIQNFESKIWDDSFEKDRITVGLHYEIESVTLGGFNDTKFQCKSG